VPEHTHIFAESALLPQGWAEHVRLEIDADGTLAAVTPGGPAAGAERMAGPVVPGMPNLHSHAFQRAMAGLAERAGPGDDSFWTWRETMYGFVRRIGPEEMAAIAAQLYVEMLEAGYTAVGEFHYVHHGVDGRPYSDSAELSRRVIGAARHAGIGITHLPVLYGYGGFGGRPAGEGQKRFVNDVDHFLRIVQALCETYRDDPQVAIGIAPHSLRAVTPETLGQAVAGLAALDAAAPVHIHIAEQTREVDECVAWSGARPVEWLLDHAAVDSRWCLVHATHMTESETDRLAASGAVAGLCPTTEANLGDGLFPAPRYLHAGGAFGIGSDSHISVSPVEELRWLEYGQRLMRRGRNILAQDADSPSVGASLFKFALSGGARALGRPIGRLAPGSRADLVVLDQSLPALYGKGGDLLVDAAVFAGNRNPVRDVMVGGRWVVRDGRHGRRERTYAAYRAALDALMA
jgi:formimidoylglutamate deiminase